jgi:hypothetical protein
MVFEKHIAIKLVKELLRFIAPLPYVTPKLRKNSYGYCEWKKAQSLPAPKCLLNLVKIILFSTLAKRSRSLPYYITYAFLESNTHAAHRFSY